MAMTPEAKVKKKVKDKLNAMGSYFLQPVGTGFGSMGAPDIVVCYKKFFIGIECKAGKGKVTALQQDNLKRIEENGGLALVINENNVDELETLIKSWIKE